jgi:hypothetical protein
MKIEKFNEGSDESKKEYPYELTDSGELIKTIEFNAQRLPHDKCVYLTDAEYDRLKDLSENTKKQCDNYDEMKKQYIKILRSAIQVVKSNSK